MHSVEMAKSDEPQHNPLRQDSGTSDDERAPLALLEEDDWQSSKKTFGVALLAVLNQIAFGYDVGAVSQCLQPIERTFRLTQLQTGFVTSALNYFAAAGALMVSGALLDRPRVEVARPPRGRPAARRRGA
mgnify:CR=1 FL=1